MTTVYRDSNGNVVNIGEWDYAKHMDYDDQGNATEVTMNPMPSGLTKSDEVVIEGFDGGLYVEDEVRSRVNR